MSWLDLPEADGAGEQSSLPLIHVGEEKEKEVVKGKHLGPCMVTIATAALQWNSDKSSRLSLFTCSKSVESPYGC